MNYKERPCPGCGEVAKRRPQRLCPRCRQLLGLGREREEKLARLRENQEDEEKITVALDTHFAYGIVGGRGAGFPDTSHRRVISLLVQLAELEDYSGQRQLISEARRIYFSPGLYYHRPRHFVWATSEQADAIETILDYVRERCRAWYDAGFRAGRDLIRRLATAGTEELNRITMDR